MALNFPAAPNTGDVHNASNNLSYVFDGQKWKSQGSYSTQTINAVKLDSLTSSFNGSLTTFNLTSSSVIVKPANAQSVMISLSGVIQEPITAYTIDSDAGTITFASAPASGTAFFGVLYSRIPHTTATIADGSITNAKVSSDVSEAIAQSKLNLSITNSEINNSAAIDASKLAFTTSKSNGVATTLQESLERVYVFEDFGAKGDWDGSSGTDDTTAITNCLAQAKANGAFALGSSGKQYRLTSTLTLNNNKIDGRNSTFIKDHAGVGIKVEGGSAFTDLKNFTLTPSTANTASDFVLTDGTEIQDGSFVANETYIIDTVGSTDFTAIGAAANTIGEIFTATGTGGSDDGGDARQLSTFKHGIWVEGTRVRADNVIVTGHKGCGIYIRDNSSSHNCNRSRYTDIICNSNSIAGLFLDGSTAADDDMAVMIIRGQFNSNKGYAVYAPQLSPIRSSDIEIQQAEANFAGSSFPANFKNEAHSDCKYAVTFDKARFCRISAYVEQTAGFELKLGDNTEMCNVYSARQNQDTNTSTSNNNLWQTGNRIHAPNQDVQITSITKDFSIISPKVGINETSPDVQLHVTSSASEVAKFESTNNSTSGCEIDFQTTRGTGNVADNDIITVLNFKGNTSSSEAIYTQLKAIATDITNNSKDAKFTFHVRNSNSMTQILEIDGGGLNVVGTVSETSDIALKDNIQKLTNSLSNILKIQGYSFAWKETGDKTIGLIAQEIEKIYPDLVTGKEGLKSLNYTGLIAPMIESIKELSDKVETLQAKVIALEAK